ncbi:MAG: DUF4364 family protein [Eubacterium sp.]
MTDDIKKMSDNEIYPKLRFDAFMANVKDGGLRSVSSIHMLVCYIVANLNSKVTAKVIIDAIDEGMIANHFEVSDAIAKLIKSSTIIENEDGTLSMGEYDYNTVELIEKDLPLTVRERSIKICQRIMAKESYQRDNKVDIEKIENGYRVTLRVSDKDNDFMTLSLFAVSEVQAQAIRDKFISNPVYVYQTLIDAIFDNE